MAVQQAFVLSGPAIEGVLDVWQPDVQSRAGKHRAFEPLENSGNLMPTWRVRLPGDADAAFRLMHGLHTELAINEHVLAQTLARALEFCASPDVAARRRTTRGTGRSQSPEGAVLNLLQPAALQAGAARGFGSVLTSGLAEAVAEFQAFLARLSLHVTNYAWVDTQIDGARFALTRVTWSGDIQTVQRESAKRAHLQVHRDAVQAALLSRQQLLRQFAVIARTAMELVSVGLLAGNPLLAFPAALKLIKLVWQELRQ